MSSPLLSICLGILGVFGKVGRGNNGRVREGVCSSGILYGSGQRRRNKCGVTDEIKWKIYNYCSIVVRKIGTLTRGANEILYYSEFLALCGVMARRRRGNAINSRIILNSYIRQRLFIQIYISISSRPGLIQ